MQSAIRKTEDVELEKAACLVIVIARVLARRILARSIARYHSKGSNYEAVKKVAEVFPDSFYAHLICALHKVENRLIGTEKMAYYAYECLDKAKAKMTTADSRDLLLLCEVEAILYHETEKVLVPYEY